MQPRVVHIVPALFDDSIGIIGGAERYALELARHMAEKTPTRLVTFGRQDETRTLGNLEIEVIGSPHLVRGEQFNPFSFRLFGRLRHSDVVHCHQSHLLSSSLTAIYCRSTRKRVFTTDLGGGGWGVTSYLDTDRWFHAHLHISRFSEAMAKHREGVRSEVIWGGVDTERFHPGPAAVQGRIVFVGRLLPHKGIDTLVRALPDGMELWIVGRPYQKQYIDDLREIAGTKRVNFLTDASEDVLIDAYQQASCVVLPSVYTTMYGTFNPVPELLGQTLLEGMACGKPAVCTSVGAMPEIVEDGVTGFVVPPGDVGSLREKLEWIRDNPELCAEMGAAGRAQVSERFTWEAVVDRCLRAYTS